MAVEGESAGAAPAAVKPPKRIVLLSDGTGNASSNVWRTNVWRIYELLDLSNSDQVAFYDDGVGTSAFRPLALLGGAFGWGLKRNVLDLYTFLCRNYEPGADIYAFGFSRGGFTVRIVCGLIVNQGIVRGLTPGEIERKALAAYRAYRRERFKSILRIEKPLRAMRDAGVWLWDWAWNNKPYDQDRIPPDDIKEIKFLGVFDSVAAYGFPVEEMTIGISRWIWPLELPDRVLSPKVHRARQALAIDDERTTFHPLLWTEHGEPPPDPGNDTQPMTKHERLSQVWFSGVHSNVGGGYAEDGLAHIPLHWMMNEAKACGLRFKSVSQAAQGTPAEIDAMRRVRAAQDKDGRMYNPRQGLGGTYRYGPRKIAELTNAGSKQRKRDDRVHVSWPKIHMSVFERIGGKNAYAPIGLPERYEVVQAKPEDDSALIFSQTVTTDNASERVAAQERVWNLVWLRRLVYFLSVIACGYIALFPMFHPTVRAAEFASKYRIVSEIIRVGEAFLPKILRDWVDAVAASPKPFLISVLVVAALLYAGSWLESEIQNRMTTIWKKREKRPVSGWHWALHKLRTHKVYQKVLRSIKFHIAPFALAVLLAVAGLAALSHLVFHIRDGRGHFCKAYAGTLRDPSPNAAVAIQQAENFPNNVVCWSTRYRVKEGERYTLTLKLMPSNNEWIDMPPAIFGSKGQPSGITGFDSTDPKSTTTRIKYVLATPLRRVILRPWFRPLARIGTTGTDEYFIEERDDEPLLDPDRPEEANREAEKVKQEISISVKARRSGELFLYVNEAVLAIPGLEDFFYRQNRGVAQFTIRHRPR